MSTIPNMVPLRGGRTSTNEPLRDLVERAKDGDTAAWEVLYDRCFEKLYRRLRFLTGDPAVAEDLTQESFVQAMLHIDQFRVESSFSTWLSAVGLNLTRKYWRREGVKKRAHGGLQVVRSLFRAAAEPDEQLAERQEEAALAAAVETLPPKLREVFTLRYLEGAPCIEVAEILGISENNVSVRAHRARTRVQETLVRQGVLDKERNA